MGCACPKSDVFSAGVVMHVLMTNRFPFSPAMFDDEASDNYVGSPKMTEINGKLHKHQIRFGREWNKFPDARDLCEAMLEVDVQKRPDLCFFLIFLLMLTNFWQILRGSFSAVSKPKFASKC